VYHAQLLSSKIFFFFFRSCLLYVQLFSKLLWCWSAWILFDLWQECSVSDKYQETQHRTKLTDQETNSMELSPSWEAARPSSTSEFSDVLWNPEAHYRIHKLPPLAPIQSQLNQVRTSQSYFCKINFNVILLPSSVSFWWFLAFWLSHQSLNAFVSSILTWSFYVYLEKSTSYRAHYAILYIILCEPG
jgi:hypothetical protein